jgi:hypothetical protein
MQLPSPMKNSSNFLMALTVVLSSQFALAANYRGTCEIPEFGLGAAKMEFQIDGTNVVYTWSDENDQPVTGVEIEAPVGGTSPLVVLKTVGRKKIVAQVPGQGTCASQNVKVDFTQEVQATSGALVIGAATMSCNATLIRSCFE